MNDRAMSKGVRSDLSYLVGKNRERETGHRSVKSG